MLFLINKHLKMCNKINIIHFLISTIMSDMHLDVHSTPILLDWGDNPNLQELGNPQDH